MVGEFVLMEVYVDIMWWVVGEGEGRMSWYLVVGLFVWWVVCVMCVVWYLMWCLLEVGN